jgi:hypothetical protein
VPLTWRPAGWSEIEQGLAIQPAFWGDALVGRKAAIEGWKRLLRDPFFASAVLEHTPAIQGHRMIGLGASVLVSSGFADAEIADPRPDINSRLIARIHSGQPVLATLKEVAQANAGEGVNLLVLHGAWRDEILDSKERQEVQTLLASSLTEWHAGYRIRRIVHETTDEPAREFAQRSLVYKAIAEFPHLGRVIHLMTHESVRAVPASLGNILFSFREPVLGLRDSDRQLLMAALGGATDPELASELGVTLSAVKARWRSTFARIEEAKPDLVTDVDSRHGRGAQKRHRVLAYVRSHPEELRPYDWKTKTRPGGLIASTTA